MKSKSFWGLLAGLGGLAYVVQLLRREKKREDYTTPVYTPIPMQPSAAVVFINHGDREYAVTMADGPAAQAAGEASFTFTLPATIDPATVNEYEQKTYQVEVKENGSGKPALTEGPSWVYQIVDEQIRAGNNTVRLLYNPDDVPVGSHCVLLTVRIKVKDQGVKKSYSGVAAVVITKD